VPQPESGVSRYLPATNSRLLEVQLVTSQWAFEHFAFGEAEVHIELAASGLERFFFQLSHVNNGQ
jgi:hypothetical protein